MAFDGIVLNAVADELRATLLNGKITKIYEPTKNDLILSFYCAPSNIALLINVQPETARIHCTTHSKPNPLQAPNFCMLLRKHLMGARLIEIHTFDLERVVEFVFETYNELKDKVIKRLIVEVMASHSNIILTNDSYVIIDSLRHVSNSNTEIMPARTYEFPHNEKHSFVELQNFSEFLAYLPTTFEEPIDKILSDTFIGISRSFVQNLVKKNGQAQDLSLHCSSQQQDGQFSLCGKEEVSFTPSSTELEVLFTSMKHVLEHISEVALEETDTHKDYCIYLKPEKESLEANFFLDDYYTQKEEKNTFVQKRNQLLSVLSGQLKKYTKRLENINHKLEECENMEQYRIYGELITSNLYRYALHSNLESITVPNYYDNQNEITIPLDKRFSVSKNAEKYFKKYNKLKNTLKIVSIQKKETLLELDYIQSILFSIETSNTLQELEEIASEMEETELFGNHAKAKPQKKNEKSKSEPFEFVIDGYTVLAGKNNKQNDLLTLKIANKQDLWFHTQNIQGSHVILKTEGKIVPDEMILKCAQIAVQNSKAKNSTHVAVDYCPVKNVKKPSGSKPGMVIYQNYKTIIV